MKKDIRIYTQKGMTCAICCMLMVLEYYNLIDKANKLLERKFYKIYRSHYLDGVPFSAVAYHFSKNGLDTKIVHSEINHFSNDKKALPDSIFNDSLKEYQDFLDLAHKNGAIVEDGKKIDAQLLKEELENNRLVILAGNHGNILHAILLSGYENDKFIICDPLCKEYRYLSHEKIESFMNTQIGKWYISVAKKD